MTDELILASSSPFRAQLVKNAGLFMKIEKAKIDERRIEKELDDFLPKEIAQKLAQEKASEVSTRFPNALVIGCDQVLELEGRILHKPADIEDAYHRLFELSGKTHHLHSGVAIFKNTHLLWSHVAVARMTMRPLNPQFVNYYLTRVGRNILSSVGAYHIEDEGIQLFEKIEGDYFTVLGLPLLPLLNEFRKLEIIDG
ncbi:MAG: septum formation protein [Candidatus Tokpelaia sp. JSC188]|nr:MAG: septum formation protein [Candidatus Tokpelaia sp. JSC188]